MFWTNGGTVVSDHIANESHPPNLEHELVLAP